MQPYYQQNGITIYHCDCREILGSLAADAVVTDPPYGDTSLSWDKIAEGWLPLVKAPQLWCFGSLRFWMASANEFASCGWKYAQEMIWEKHNGSGFHADRFKRVHEIAVHWYRGKWGEIYKSPPTTSDATRRTVRRKERPQHTGAIDNSTYSSIDGGPRLMRSVLQVRSCHGRAVHPTQKPEGIIGPQILFSVPAGGLVVDPFMGSGTTLVVARNLGRCAIGIERDESYCESAVRRLRQKTLFEGP